MPPVASKTTGIQLGMGRKMEKHTACNSMSLFKKATRVRIPLKLAITGGAGTTKTMSALRLATGLANKGKIAVLDTENESASLYSDEFQFDTMNISPPYTDEKCVNGLRAAVSEGYSVAIVDSYSHFWEGTLDYKASLDARGGNSYTNWNAAGKKFRSTLDAILQAPIHVICCLRSKMDYVLETDIRGKQVPRKIGLQPVMRDGIEYEFTVVFDGSTDHFVTVSKDRTKLFLDQHFQITEETGRQLLDWLSSAPEPTPEPTPQQRLAVELTDIDPETLSAYLIKREWAADGSVLSVPDKYATGALAALPRLREAIEHFRQQAAPNGAAQPATNNQ